MTPPRTWPIRLAAAAEADYADAVRWSIEQFGLAQGIRYEQLLADALASLTVGPGAPGSRRREELGHGLWSLHVSRRGRPGRHVVIFRVVPDERGGSIEIVRLLHDAMDAARHVATPPTPHRRSSRRRRPRSSDR